jgi:hypothetical protein
MWRLSKEIKGSVELQDQDSFTLILGYGVFYLWNLLLRTLIYRCFDVGFHSFVQVGCIKHGYQWHILVI